MSISTSSHPSDASSGLAQRAFQLAPLSADTAIWAISKVMESDVRGFKSISDSLSLGESTVAVARQAACRDDQLEAPVLDFSIPRRIRPSFGFVPYSHLLAGEIQVDARRLRCAPAHSPRLAEEIGAGLIERLPDGSFPLRLPLLPLSDRPGLIPLEG